MQEEHLSRLRRRLEQKKERLFNEDFADFVPKLHRFWAFMAAEPAFKAILAELEGNEKALTAVSLSQGTSAAQARAGVADSPLFAAQGAIKELKTDDGMAAFGAILMKGVAEQRINLSAMHQELLGAARGQPLLFYRRAFGPLCDYLADRLDEQQAILGLLVRYRERSEWFHSAGLRKLVEDEEARAAAVPPGEKERQARVEKALMSDLYRYLHDCGRSFSVEEKSGVGEIDIIDRTGGECQYLEGKVFDDKRRKKDYILQGFRQLLVYLRRYNASKGYLIVYGITDQSLAFTDWETLGGVPFVRFDGKTLYVLPIDLFKHEKTASKREANLVDIKRVEVLEALQVPASC